MADAWIDVSIPIRRGMITWPGDPPVEVEQVASLERGDPAAVRRIAFGTHTGTHVDAPAHYIEGGESLDAMPLDVMVGPARVIRVHARGAIAREELESAQLAPGERVLLRTANSDARWDAGPFRKDFVHLGVEAARFLAERRVRLVGVDYLSVGGFADEDQGPAVHRALLSAGVWVLEGLYLGDVEAGWHELVCLPLRVENGDGAPARALVRPLGSRPR